MTDDTNPRATIGGNKPPVEPPTDTAALDDLRTRYPEVTVETAQIETAFATVPAKIETEDQAKVLSDLLGKASKQRSVFKTHRGTEKKRWDGIVKIVQNFFGGAEEKLDGLIDTYKPRLDAYRDAKLEGRRSRTAGPAGRG